MSEIPRLRRIGVAPILLATAAVLWSGNFVAGRALGSEVSAIGLNFWRWTVALVVLLPIAWSECRRHGKLIRASWRYLSLLALTGVATFHIFVYKALEYSEATNALLMLSTAPALIMISSRMVFGEAITVRQWIGIALSLSGAVILICRGELAVLTGFGFGQGELWMLAAVPAWAAYSILLKHRPRELPQGATLTASTAIGLAWMTPLVLWRPGVLDITWTPAVTAGILYMGVGASVLAFLCWNKGVATIGPARAGAFLHLMPLAGTALAVALLGEAVHAYHALGGLLVFAGIGLSQHGAGRADGEGSRRVPAAAPLGNHRA